MKDADDMAADSPSTAKSGVSEKNIIKMIGYLQSTCQLVPESQIIESETKYPVQEYTVGSPMELTYLGKEMKKDELSNEAMGLAEGTDGGKEW
eukprot:CAMPEP_0197247850 /NCGR_PEP_ID=MMETSP1429-20130617/32517_1 /TAXON_ID=49237 /ORGANISM="Chaetoceros  sp., Strain UNC1202" /LENGTH=92 /DNA_ID=CAMNT_0042708881 /DNA_START=81 /DNA_END=356 /DNA_ORIENTATION=+